MNKDFYITILSGLALSAPLMLSTAHAQTDVAFSNPTPLPASGFQTGGSQLGSPFVLGLEFSVVNKPIVVTGLGAFDSTIGGSGTGFTATGPVLVGIYNTGNSSFFAPTATFNGTAASSGSTVVDSYQFQSINALTLGVGTYIVVAAGYGIPGAADWNAFLATPVAAQSPIAVDTGGGAVTFVGNLYDNDPNGNLIVPTTAGNMPGGYGVTLGGPSFQYTVPEPTGTELAFVSAGILGVLRFCKFRRRISKAS